MEFRYSFSGKKPFKGNTHVHSIFSDGHKDHHELAELYVNAGYDFIFFTDHRYADNVTHTFRKDLLMLNGIELDGKDGDGSYYHIVGLDFRAPFDPELPLEKAISVLPVSGSKGFGAL